jgi:protein tyrosine/serine phosphatase
VVKLIGIVYEQCLNKSTILHLKATWDVRLFKSVKMALVALMMGYSVLVHCKAGKHRSGAVVALLLALLTGMDLSTAMDTYFVRHGQLSEYDKASAPRQICAHCGHF